MLAAASKLVQQNLIAFLLCFRRPPPPCRRPPRPLFAFLLPALSGFATIAAGFGKPIAAAADGGAPGVEYPVFSELRAGLVPYS